MKRYDLDSFDQLVEREDGSMCCWEDVQSLQAERDRLRSELANLLHAYEQPDRQLCCSGRDCGCMGVVWQDLSHYDTTSDDLPEQAVGDGVTVWMIRSNAGVVHWDETGCVFPDEESAQREATLMTDSDPDGQSFGAFALRSDPRPAVATPAEVTEGLSNVIEWHERERDTQRKLGHDSQADMHDCYASVIHTLTAKCQVRKDGEVRDGQ